MKYGGYYAGTPRFLLFARLVVEHRCLRERRAGLLRFAARGRWGAVNFQIAAEQVAFGPDQRTPHRVRHRRVGVPGAEPYRSRVSTQKHSDARAPQQSCGDCTEALPFQSQHRSQHRLHACRVGI